MKAGYFSFISRLMDGSSTWSKRARPLLDRLFAKWIPARPDESLGWAADAEWAQRDQEPLRARYLLRVVAVILLAFLVWASFATVDEVTRGSGEVIPSRQVQIIQAVDGGVVSEILVREGQMVEAGQSLFRIDETRFVSSLRENRVQYLALLAKASRLRALAENTPFVLPPEIEKEDPKLVEEERSMYDARRNELEAQISIARQQLTQRQQELVEIKSRQAQAAHSHDLTSQELSMTRPLLATGAVSDVDLLRLERDIGRYRGERDQAAAQALRVQAAIQEASRKIQELEIVFRNQMRDELADTVSKLNSLSEGSTALTDRVTHANVKSPVKGTVKRLLVTTVGGVLQPGQEIVEIVPTEDALLLEARILPKDIAFLRPGQKAMVRFTAYDFAIYGGLEAEIEHIAADTFTDEEGNAFYLVRVKTLKSSLGKSMPIIPGMVAEVDIITGRKSILAYLLKPVIRAKTHAFTER